MTSGTRRRVQGRTRKIWNLVLAIFFFILGVVGIFIPVMPQLIFFAMSLFFLSLVFPPVRRWTRRFLRRHPKVARAYDRWRHKGRRKRQELIRKRKAALARLGFEGGGNDPRSPGK